LLYLSQTSFPNRKFKFLNDIAKPFLRWAGGKTWLLKHLADLQLDYANYHEPFLGGAAVFLYLRPKRSIFLSDLNSELVHTYMAIKDDVSKVIIELKKFQNTETEYYRIRQANFTNDYRRAAKFVFLNQTSFNGIYRVNLKGQYNVPYGFRNVPIYDPENLLEISAILKKAKLYAGDFSSVSKHLKENDLVFLDPPYTVTHNNNGFVKYNQKLFSLDDQYRLSNLIDDIKLKKAYYILTNAAHNKIEEIFEKGDTKVQLTRASLIGGTNAKRGQFAELLFTNIYSFK